MEDKKLSKKEKRELAKERKRQEKRKKELTSKLKKTAFLLAILAVALFFGKRTYDYFTAPVPEVAQQPIQVVESDWVKGEEEAEVTLIEYGDFQCPACGAYFPVVTQLLEDYPDDLKVVYRHFPLVNAHPNAMPAAKSTEAAGIQGKFWEMHDMLFQRQERWSSERNVKEIFGGYAEELGLDKSKFLEDFESDAVQEKIDADMQSARTLSVNATPTFFLNGQKVQPRSYEEFRSLVDEQLAE